MEEKKKLLLHRAIPLVIMLIFIILSLPNARVPKIVNDECSTDTYYSSLDETSCTLCVYFDCEVDSGYVKVEFYDGEKLLDSQAVYCISYGDYVESIYFTVEGYPDSYRILSTSIEASSIDKGFWIGLALIAFAYFLGTLTYNYKRYSLDGKEIIVYAGAYHHYIKIDGEIYDEHNTVVSYSCIYLQCLYKENLIEATVTMSNRISTKINGKLVQPIK